MKGLPCRISSAQREELQKFGESGISVTANLRQPKPVSIVPKSWYEQFCAYCEGRTSTEPPMHPSRRSKTGRQDTLPFDEKSWQEIKRILGLSEDGIQKGVYIIDPVTDQPRILEKDVAIEIRTSDRTLLVDVDENWTVQALTCYGCRLLGKDPNTSALYAANKVADPGQKLSGAIRKGQKIFELKERKASALPSLAIRKEPTSTKNMGNSTSGVREKKMGRKYDSQSLPLIAQPDSESEKPRNFSARGSKASQKAAELSVGGSKKVTDPPKAAFTPLSSSRMLSSNQQSSSTALTDVKSKITAPSSTGSPQLTFSEKTVPAFSSGITSQPTNFKQTDHQFSTNSADTFTSNTNSTFSARSSTLPTSSSTISNSPTTDDKLSSTFPSRYDRFSSIAPSNYPPRSDKFSASSTFSSGDDHLPDLSPVSSSSFPRPVGLMNLGNTCFFNAAVQCLARVPSLCRFTLSSDFDHCLNTSNPKGSRGSIARAWKRFLTDMCSASTTRDPSDLRSAVVSKFRRFANYGQHDSQELLCSLLDGLHEDLNQSASARGSRPAITPGKDADSWDMHLAKNASQIVDIFHGRLYSSLECPSCRTVSAVHDPFAFLSLEIPMRYSAMTLRDCLASFSSVDTLDEANKWRCEKCQQKVCATKKMGVDRCAEILVVHLKRFSAERYSKIDTAVEYPDVLDTADFAAVPTGRYRLIGAVFHSGGLGGGHYTAAALDQPSGQWFYFNDSSASRVEKNAAHKGTAYILVYEKM